VTRYLKPPNANSVIQVLAALGAAIGLVVSFVLGLFALAIVAGVILLLALVLGIRVAWLRRKWRQQAAEMGKTEPPTGSGETLEAEFEVISRNRR
jgi:predicted lipid-binding transport protein (Tim44 family)